MPRTAPEARKQLSGTPASKRQGTWPNPCLGVSRSIIMDLPQDGAHRPYCTPTDPISFSWRANRFPRAYLKVFSVDFCFITF